MTILLDDKVKKGLMFRMLNCLLPATFYHIQCEMFVALCDIVAALMLPVMYRVLFRF